jgi:hypothetical protein
MLWLKPLFTLFISIKAETYFVQYNTHENAHIVHNNCINYADEIHNVVAFAKLFYTTYKSVSLQKDKCQF